MRAALNAVTLARGLSPLKAAQVTAAAGFSSIGMWYDALRAFGEKKARSTSCGGDCTTRAAVDDLTHSMRRTDPPPGSRRL
ncbi:MAG: hypothetical protein ACYC63_03810 [Armatimonadota bacterium]